MRSIVLGGGCFWCLEAVFEGLQGVASAEPGYAGGWDPSPTYREVCRGTTGHAEVVQLRYDPEVIGLDQLLDLFFTVHDPTTPDRQGADVGPQYRSIILVERAEDGEVARRVMEAVTRERRWPDPLVTQLVPLEHFFPAEAEHRDYYRRNPLQPYCQVAITPKVAKARKAFGDLYRSSPA